MKSDDRSVDDRRCDESGIQFGQHLNSAGPASTHRSPGRPGATRRATAGLWANRGTSAGRCRRNRLRPHREPACRRVTVYGCTHRSPRVTCAERHRWTGPRGRRGRQRRHPPQLTGSATGTSARYWSPRSATKFGWVTTGTPSSARSVRFVVRHHRGVLDRSRDGLRPRAGRRWSPPVDRGHGSAPRPADRRCGCSAIQAQASRSRVVSSRIFLPGPTRHGSGPGRNSPP